MNKTSSTSSPSYFFNSCSSSSFSSISIEPLSYELDIEDFSTDHSFSVEPFSWEFCTEDSSTTSFSESKIKLFEDPSYSSNNDLTGPIYKKQISQLTKEIYNFKNQSFSISPNILNESEHIINAKLSPSSIASACFKELKKKKYITIIQNIAIKEFEGITYKDLKSIKDLPLESLELISIKYSPKDAQVRKTHELAFLKKLTSLTDLKIEDSSAFISKEGIRNITNLSLLTKLSLPKNNFNIQTIKLLGKLNQSIKSLNLYKCNINDDYTKEIANIKSLTFLNLKSNKNISSKGLNHLNKLSNLKTLNISNCPSALKYPMQSDDIQKQSFPFTNQFQKLEVLYVNLCWIDEDIDKFEKQLNLIKTLPRITSIYTQMPGEAVVLMEGKRTEFLKHRYSGKVGLNRLKRASILPSSSSLKEANSLNLSNTNIQPDDLRKAVILLPDLFSINLSHSTGVTDEALKYCKEFNYLQSLNLSGNPLISDKEILALMPLKSLTSLDISHCPKITNKSLKFLTPLILQLESLNISNNPKITDKGLTHLTPFSQLNDLDISHCPRITNKGLTHLNKFIQWKSLNLSGNPLISDEGLNILTTTKRIRSLNISGCLYITNKGLKKLKSWKKSLTSLNLSQCKQLSNNGIKTISTLTNLESLNISQCELITYEGLEHLLKPSQLKFVNLSGCALLQERDIDDLAEFVNNIIFT